MAKNCVMVIGLAIALLLPIGCQKGTHKDTSPEKVSASGAKYKIAFVTSRHGGGDHHNEEDGSGNREIYIIDADGKNERRVTDNPANDTEPAWSPDAKRIVFASNRDGNDELYIVELETGKTTRLTNNKAIDCQPSWSPDGKYIAFASDRRKKNWDVYIMSATNNDWENGEIGTMQITHSEGTDAQPAWSPDGTKLAYIQSPTSDKSGQRWDIYIADALTGKNPRKVSTFEGINFSPTWTLDGKGLIYMSTRDNNEDLYLLDIKTGQEKRLTNDAGAEDMPSVSPDGRHIAFMHAEEEEEGEIHDIYVMNLETRKWRRLTTSPASEFHPRWSPVPVEFGFKK